MRIISAVLGAVVIVILYYGAVWLLDRKLSLQLAKKKMLFADECISDKFVLAVAIITFAVWCYLGSDGEACKNFFVMLQNMAVILAMSIFAVTDTKAKLIPNRLILVFLGIWSAICGIAFISDPEGGIALIGQSLIGGVVGGLIFLLCYLISRGQLGAGDVKLAFVMGLYLTGQRVVGAIAYGVLLCCIYSFIQIARKKLTMKDGVPLAPFLYLGTIVTFMIL